MLLTWLYGVPVKQEVPGIEGLFVGLLGTENISELVEGPWKEAAVEKRVGPTVLCSDCPAPQQRGPRRGSLQWLSQGSSAERSVCPRHRKVPATIIWNRLPQRGCFSKEVTGPSTKGKGRRAPQAPFSSYWEKACQGEVATQGITAGKKHSRVLEPSLTHCLSGYLLVKQRTSVRATKCRGFSLFTAVTEETWIMEDRTVAPRVRFLEPVFCQPINP